MKDEMLRWGNKTITLQGMDELSTAWASCTPTAHPYTAVEVMVERGGNGGMPGGQ